MEPQKSSIRALPPEAVAQIKSSTVITHLNGVVSELLKNSLDADSGIVSVTVDFQKGSCTVEDDGCGIPPAEFRPGGGVGRLHRKDLPTTLTFWFWRHIVYAIYEADLSSKIRQDLILTLKCTVEKARSWHLCRRWPC